MAKVKVPTADEITGMWQASGLKQKLIFTFIIIAVFRFGTQIPIFGINQEALINFAGNNIIGFLDIFSGGAIGKVSIFALGIGTYITASIIMQLLAVVVPSLESLQKEEGEAGRRKISQYTRIFTVGLAAFQSFVFMSFITRQPGLIMHDANMTLVVIQCMIALVTGSVLVMWLAELITERGLGNGGSILIFVGIISRIPLYFNKTGALVSNNPGAQFGLVLLLIVFLATIYLIVFMQEAVRKVIIVNAKRQVGNKVYGGVNTHIPFKLNPGGVMPIIFAVAILLFPSILLGTLSQANIPNPVLRGVVSFLSLNVLNPNKFPYYIIYFGLIVTLTFFYASIMPNMQPKEIANNLKKYGSSIPGIKPGKPTADLIDQILSRITFIGAIGLGIIAIVPGVASHITNISTLTGLGASTLIIMVGVALDLINQIKTHLLVRQYEGFLKQ